MRMRMRLWLRLLVSIVTSVTAKMKMMHQPRLDPDTSIAVTGGVPRLVLWDDILAYLSESLLFWLDAVPCVFLRLGDGMRHSIWKATQLVHGTPRLAASHRTYSRATAALDCDMACAHGRGASLYLAGMASLS